MSPLVFKHVIFEANPLVAGLFLIHERKLSETFFQDSLFLGKKYERGTNRN